MITPIVSKFPLGQVVVTAGISHDVEVPDIHRLLERHASGDWGDLVDEDKASNDAALTGEGRILSAYETPKHGKIWVITEWDRSVTTVLYPDEY